MYRATMDYPTFTPPSPSQSLPSSPTQALEPEKDFIITFETLPVLWDRFHEHYTNRRKRNKALQTLLNVLKKIKPTADIDDVKKKINSLRSNYRRELKRIETSKRTAVDVENIYTPRSWTFEYLHFLHDVVQLVEPNENLNDDERTKSEALSSHKNMQTTYSQRNTIRKSPKNQHNTLDRASYQMESRSNNLIAFDWLETLNSLDPMQKLYAKKAINDILFEAQLGTLNRYSVKINDHEYASSPT